LFPYRLWDSMIISPPEALSMRQDGVESPEVDLWEAAQAIESDVARIQPLVSA
jgi:hypothetical protein